MGVDFMVCNNCGETFPDCGDYVYCDGCGTRWCSDDCAEEEGYDFAEESCGLYGDISDVNKDSIQCQYKFENGYCGYRCEHKIIATCGYCRSEIFEDSQILNKALELLGKKRSEIEDMLRKEA